MNTLVFATLVLYYNYRYFEALPASTRLGKADASSNRHVPVTASGKMGSDKTHCYVLLYLVIMHARVT